MTLGLGEPGNFRSFRFWYAKIFPTVVKLCFSGASHQIRLDHVDVHGMSRDIAEGETRYSSNVTNQHRNKFVDHA